MKKAVLILILGFSPLLSFCQCNVTITREPENNKTVFQTRFEDFYKNEDLENGLNLAKISSAGEIIKNGKDTITNLFFKVTTATTRSFSPVIPRVLVINFTGGGTIVLFASTYEVIDEGLNRSCYVSTFKILNNQLLLLLSKGVYSIDVKDTRANTNIVSNANLYPNLLKEQIECIIKQGD